MKQRIIVVLAASLSVILLSWIGITFLSAAPKENNESLPPLDNAQEVYASAASQAEQRKDLSLRIALTKEITVDTTVFLEVSEIIAQYNTEGLIQIQETLTSGSHTIDTTEILSDNTLYLTVNDTSFVSTCDAAQYRQTLIPAVILTPDYYGSITGTDTGSHYAIQFSNPVNIEPWTADSDVSMTEARGSAVVDYEGRLLSSMYTVAYQKNGVAFRTTAHVAIEDTEVDISLPDAATYTQIGDWRAPKALERACGYLIQADRISSAYQDSIYFQAIGDLREQSIDLHAYNDSQWSICMTTEVRTKNDTKQDQQAGFVKKELFKDGQYSVATGTDPLSYNPGITVDTMYNYFQNQLVSTVILPKDIYTADINESDSTMRIEFTGTETFGEHLTQNACQILYQNPNLIADTGAKVQTDTLVCYLEIDKLTGLPIGSGITFKGSYKTQGLRYQLTYSAEQLYSIPSDVAQAEIEKAAGQ